MKHPIKYHYYAVNVQEDGKNYAYVVKASENDNLLSVFGRIAGLVSVNNFSTKKRAADVVIFWNECYKANGTYMFGGSF